MPTLIARRDQKSPAATPWAKCLARLAAVPILLNFVDMFAFCLLGTTAALSVGVIIAVMRRAPEAYEDEGGLTIIRHQSHGPVGSHSAILATNRPDSVHREWWLARHFLSQAQLNLKLQKRFSRAESAHHFFHAFFHNPANRSLRGSNPQPLP
jgi:hypothetical protein